MWRRILAGSPYVDVNGRRNVVPWAVSEIDDYEPVDLAWERAVRAGDAASQTPLAPRLDLRLLTAAFPARRRYSLSDGQGERFDLEMPSAWEAIAYLLAIGPDRLHYRANQYLAEVADRGAAGNSLAGLCTVVNGFALDAADASRWLPGLASWQNMPKLRPTRAMRRRAPAEDHNPAPTLAQYRAAQAKLERRLAATKHLSGDWADSDEQEILKKLVVLGMVGETGARIAEVAPVRRGNVEADVPFGDGLSGPAVWIAPAKDVPIAPYHRPISRRLYDHIDRFCRLWGNTGPGDPVVPSSRFEPKTPADPIALSGWFMRTNVLPGEHAKDGRHALHDCRAFGHQNGMSVGTQLITAQPTRFSRLDAKTFADAYIGHTFTNKSYNYDKLERLRSTLAALVAFGDPRRGVTGSLELLCGEAGQRKIWSDQVLREVHSALLHADDLEHEANHALERALSLIKSLERSLSRSAVTTEIEADDHGRALVLVQQRLEEMAQRDALRDQLDEAKHQEHTADKQIAKAKALRREAHDRKKMLSVTGPNLPVEDEAVVSPALLDETFEEAFLRVGIEFDRSTIASVATVADDSMEIRLREREVLNLAEWAAIWATTPRQAARWYLGQGKSPIDLRGAREHFGPRTRFINVRRLPGGWEELMTLRQHQQLEMILRMPAGETRWGGARYPGGNRQGDVKP